MADIGPPPPVIDFFHLTPVLTYIADAVYADLQSRGILITNQNSQQQQLSQFLAAINALTSALSSSTAQLSENIAAVSQASAAQFDSLTASIEALGTNLSAQIDTFNTNVANLLTLLEAMIQAFQGVATLDGQNQMLALLSELVNFTSPERPKTIGLDLTHVVTEPQPTPSRSGP